jgi:glycosyltransferase involved in cell wall biosynthesis
MKIHFSNVTTNTKSGSNAFALRLKRFLEVNGCQVVDHNQDYDIFLSFGEAVTPCRNNAILVQRVPSIYMNPKNFKVINEGVERTYKQSDFVIWQSEFSKNIIQNFWGNRRGEVIHNGSSLFPLSPVPSIRENGRPIFVSSGNWSASKRLGENVKIFDKIKLAYPNAVLYIMGTNPDQSIFRGRKDIRYLGSLDGQMAQRVYATSDWMIHAAWNDNCPNAVVEAMSQGCPVICTSSGGTKEIVKSRGIIIEEPEDKLLNANIPAVDLTHFMGLPRIDSKFDVTDLDINKVGTEYLNVFKNLLK